MGVSCSADRQALGKITKDGVFLEKVRELSSHLVPHVSCVSLALLGLSYVVN